MRIATTGMPDLTPTDKTGASAAADDTPAPASTASSAASAGPSQSAALAPALAALRKMPDIDLAKVDQLRDALAKGEMPFDPAKLAGLIKRFHGGHS
ncbi:MAG TPA: flagellar biosynthesis anti-sigma factor FlgM [Burkholderiaceae bacterium]